MPSFNLIDQPFIPCVTPGGSVEYVGIKAALVRAHEFAELRDPSPLVTIALHRLLLAILHAAFQGPEDKKKWRQVWDTGAFDPAPIERYLATRHDRFDLFHENHPFFQDATLTGQERSGAHRLALEESPTHRHKLFSHTTDADRPLMSSAEAARLLIAHQSFTISGGRGYRASPASGGVVLLVQGNSLFKTLALNWIQYNLEIDQNDYPAWERSRPVLNDDEIPDGPVDYLTWQSRSIRLHPGEDGIVREISYAPGRCYDPPAGARLDPMTTYYASRGKAFAPVQLSEEKDLWRDSAAFFGFENLPGAEKQTNPPKVLRWLRELRNAKSLTDGSYSLAAFGLCTDKAKVNFWRQDTFPLPLQYLTEDNLVATLRDAITLAEAVGSAIWLATAEVARLILVGAVDRKPDENRKKQMVKAVGADALYYSSLGEPFRRLMGTLPLAVDGDDDNDNAKAHRRAQLRVWFNQTLTIEAHRAFKQTVWQAADRIREERAAVAGENQLRSRLAALGRQYHLTDDSESKEPQK